MVKKPQAHLTEGLENHALYRVNLLQIGPIDPKSSIALASFQTIPATRRVIAFDMGEYLTGRYILNMVLHWTKSSSSILTWS